MNRSLPESADRPTILVTAHGERRGGGENLRLRHLTSQLELMLPEAEVRWALLNEPGHAKAALADAGRAIVVPILFSDGYFYQRLFGEVSGPSRIVAPPLGLWPDFASFLANGLTAPDCSVLLVAHGSKGGGRSSAAARDLAAGLEAVGFTVECGFLEEEPFAVDVAVGMAGPYALIGLFFGDGLHGGEDFRSLAARPGVRTAVTVGEMSGLAGLIAAETRRLLATMPRS